MRKVKLLLLLICFGASLALYAGETGSLVGKVKDEEGKPIQGVVVLVKAHGELVGSTLTNEKGSYQIPGLPPDKYSVEFKRTGKNPVKYEDVAIQVDLTKNLNITMTVKTLIGKTLVFKEKKGTVLQEQAGGDKITKDAAKLEIEGIQSMDELLQSSPSTVTVGGETHARGGRSNETTVMIDGMQVSDPVDGGAGLSVDMDAVQTTDQMFSFPAEYGNSQSGVVNIVTKTGKAKYEGSIKYGTDHLVGDGYNYDKLSFTLGGPVWPGMKKLTFFVNGGVVRSDGRDGQWRENNPYEDFSYDGSALLNNELYNTKSDPYAGRDSFLGIDLDERNYNSYNYNTKLKYNFSLKQKMTIAVRGNYSNALPYSHAWKYALENYAKTEDSQTQIVGNYDIISGSSVLRIKASYNHINSKQMPRHLSEEDFWSIDETQYAPTLGLYGVVSVDQDNDGILDDGGYLGSELWVWNEKGEDEEQAVSGFYAPGTFISTFNDNTTENIQFRADYEFTPEESVHKIKTGIELQRHFIERDEVGGLTSVDEAELNNNLITAFDNLGLTPTGIDVYSGFTVSHFPENDICDSIYTVYDNDGEIENEIYYYKPEYYRYMLMRSVGSREGYKASPWQAAYYIQDQFEFEEMRVNAGLRFDWWYLNNDYEIQEVDGSFRTKEFDGETSQLLVSPRFGILYPISERDRVTFTYNYQNQLPQMKHIFTTKDPEVDGVSYLNVGNPELEPQITVTYQVGYEHQFERNPDYNISIQAYYKNIYNYVSTKYDTLESDKDITFFQYVSEDYGSAKGLEIELSKDKGSSYIDMGLSYSLGWAKGNNDEAVSEVTRTSLREFRLPWDVRHTAKFRVNFIVSKDEDFFIPWTDINVPFGKYGMFNTGFNYSFSSGSPYTPVNDEDRALEKYSKEQPYVDEASLFFRKEFRVSDKQKFNVTFSIDNLFDKRNVVAVYAKTGDPFDDGADLTSAGSDFVSPQKEFMHYLAAANPSRKTDGRTFRLEFSYNFDLNNR